MNLSEMRTTLRRDLKDEEAADYRWTDDELDRHIAHAVRDFSGAVPLEARFTTATGSGSRDIDISGLADRIMVTAVEYPVAKFPVVYQRFAIWGDSITLLGDDVPDGSDAHIFYGRLHTLDGTTSTIPSRYEDLIAAAAAGYAAVEWAIYATNRVNVGGKNTPAEFLDWGKEKLGCFKSELRRLGRQNRVRISSLYKPHYPVKSKTSDFGPP